MPGQSTAWAEQRARDLTAACAAMPESELQAAVAGECRRLGLRHYHTHNSRRSEPGWPDSVIVGPHGVLFRELKRQTQHPTAVQRQWLAALTAAGQDVAVWRPSDWHDGTIARQLAAIRYGNRIPQEARP